MNPDSLRCLVAMILLSAIGNSVLVVQPIAVGAMVDMLEFTERQAGFVVFAELGSFSLGSVVMSVLIHRLDRQHVAYMGITLLAVGNCASFLATEFLPFLAIRTIPGFGCSLAIAAFLSTAVLTKLPDKVFGLVNAFSIGYSAVLLTIAPALVSHGGLAGIYFAMGAAAFLCAAIVRWIPAKISLDGVKMDSTRGGYYTDKLYVSMLLMVLAAMLLLYTGHGAVWAFQERIANALGVVRGAVGQILGISMFIGIIGSLIAWQAGLIIGRFWPQIVSLGISVLAALLLVYTGSAVGFAVASGLVALSWFYGLPYQMGLLAQLDPEGRANVMGLIMTTGGAALGPAIAGSLISPGQYLSIGWFAAGCYSICLAFVIPAVFFINRHERRVAVAR